MMNEKINPANAIATPTLFFIVGLMGCGKSYWGKYLSNKNNFLFIDLDKAIELYVKMSISDVFNYKGETFFRGTETEVLKKIKQDSYKNIQL
jgi:shikimate kinase